MVSPVGGEWAGHLATPSEGYLTDCSELKAPWPGKDRPRVNLGHLGRPTEAHATRLKSQRFGRATRVVPSRLQLLRPPPRAL